MTQRSHERAAAKHEPAGAGHQAGPAHAPAIERRIEHGLKVVERVLIYVVAIFLIGFAVLALVNTVTQVRGYVFATPPDYGAAITKGIDSAFLTVILLELLHTVLSRGAISQQLQEFLIIGITSAVRHSLEITAGGERRASRDIVVDLAINAFGVLILVAALWLIRQQRPTAQRDVAALLGGDD